MVDDSDDGDDYDANGDKSTDLDNNNDDIDDGKSTNNDDNDDKSTDLDNNNVFNCSSVHQANYTRLSALSHTTVVC